MKALLVILAIVLGVGPTWSQTSSSRSDKPAKIIQHDMKNAPHTAAQNSFPQEWRPLNPEASIDEIIDELTKAGWDAAGSRSALSGAEDYVLLTRTLGPGIKSFLAVPRNNYSAAVEFSPSVQEVPMSAAFWRNAPSSDQIRQEIVDGMQAAIEALCGMKARPSSIRAQASAFGVVEVEATWEAAEVCD